MASSLDLYYLSTASNIFRFGYLTTMSIGLFGNICQIITFSRKNMRSVSTGVLFLALSISDTLFLLLCTYVMVVFGFQQPDQSIQFISCRIRHFTSNLVTNFSAWMLAIISCDRWTRTQFPVKAQTICTPRKAIYAMVVAGMIDAVLHVHLLTPFFGPLGPGAGASCGPNRAYPWYVYFHGTIWPVLSILTVTILPATAMIAFLVGIIIRIHAHRNRVAPVSHPQRNRHENRRTNFIHRQMCIMMIMTLFLFFIASLPVACYRFTVSTLKVQQPFSLNLLLTAIFGVITACNYAFNFYLHCLTSKLYRKEFLRAISVCRPVSFHPNTSESLIDMLTKTIGHQKGRP